MIIVSVLPRQRHIPSARSHKSVGSALLAEDFDVGLSPEGTLKSVLWDCVLPLLAACLPCSCTRLVASVRLRFSGEIGLKYSVCSSVKITSLLIKRPFDLRFLMISLDVWMSVKKDKSIMNSSVERVCFYMKTTKFCNAGCCPTLCVVPSTVDDPFLSNKITLW